MTESADQFRHREGEQSGTGEARSGNSGPGGVVETADEGGASEVGAMTSTQPTDPAAEDINRSGSGGSGGSFDPSEEGSSGQSLDDLLQGGPPEEGPRH